MKIALLSEKYTPDLGGLAISTGRLGDLLASVGYDVRLFAPTQSTRLRTSPNLPPIMEQTLHSNGVHVTRFAAHKRVDDTLLKWFELIVEEHSREPFDLIHAYFLPMAGFVGTYAGKYLNIPSVVSIRGNDIERAAFDPSKFSHVMYALQNASAVTTNAKILAKKAGGFSEREIHIIPNGIDADHFQPMNKNADLAIALGLEEGNPVIGFVGELREKKGLSTLLFGYAKVNGGVPASLLIVGEVRAGADEQALSEFRTANPHLNVIVTGYIPHKDLPNYYSLMDIFVHPSLRDGMPNAVLEAMACEVAVIATPVGGVIDVLEDGKNGVFTSVNDVQDLTVKMVELLNDHDKRTRLGKNARESITARFTLESELKANLDIYHKLVIPAK